MADSSEHAQDCLKMKVADLKKELKARGLNTSGNKTELIDRLQAALINDPAKTGNISSEELIDDVLNDEDLEEEIEEEVDEMEKSLDIDTSVISPEDTSLISPTLSTPAKKLKRKSSEVTDENNFNKAPPKKIVLNRALAVNILQNKTEQNKDSKTLDLPSPTTPDEESDKQPTTSERRVVKLSNLTAKERLEMRAKKFGAPLTPEQRKVARQARFGSTENSSTTLKTNSDADPKIDVLKKRAERFGIVSSTMAKIDIQERLEKRKARFGAVNTTPIKRTTITTK